MTLKKWAVVYKDTGIVYRMFKERGEANYCVTDCFGPEGNKMFIMETCEPLINVEFEGINHSDAHDYSDAYISYAEKENGEPLTEEELDAIPSDVAYDYLISYLY